MGSEASRRKLDSSTQLAARVTKTTDRNAASLAKSKALLGPMRSRDATALQRVIGNRATTTLLAVGGSDSFTEARSGQIYASRAVVQRVAENQTSNRDDIGKLWAARDKIGVASRGVLKHNVAVDAENANSAERSASNSHAELLVAANFGMSRGPKSRWEHLVALVTGGGTTSRLRILSERRACEECWSDLQNMEKDANPSLAITVDYLVAYRADTEIAEEAAAALGKVYDDEQFR